VDYLAQQVLAGAQVKQTYSYECIYAYGVPTDAPSI